MAPSRPFSIYLLKESFDALNALEANNSLRSADADNLPTGATLLVHDGPRHSPWWKAYFGVQRTLLQSSKGAMVFLPVDERVFVLCFGHVAHNLKDESYEYDFGIRTTLNCVDPQKLKNTDTVEPGSARRQRTQHALETDLTYFDFDADSAVLKSITGKVKDEHADIVRHATGASSLRISTPVPSDELTKLCSRLLVLYQDDSYLTSFPDIQKIAPVRDPGRIADLNTTLLADVHARADSVRLTTPALIDYEHDNDSLYVRFLNAGRSMLYPDVAIEHYYQHLDESGLSVDGLTVEQLKSHRLALTDEFGEVRQSYTIFKSLHFDTADGTSGSTFYLNEGNWYEVDSSYISDLRARLDPFWSDLAFLADCPQDLEGDYNADMGKKSGFVCLDRTSVSPKGQTGIEPCDIYLADDGKATLVHVKISTDSSLLSHLFNQGTNSVELLRSEDSAPGRLVKLIRTKANEHSDVDALVAAVHSGNYAVVFAIITRKDPNEKSLNLPLFSRISLARNIKALDRVMRVPVSFGFIKHTAPRKPPKPKTRRRGQPSAAS
ncbi:DUF6119 family protein [Lentzea flaviverrucosa]|uniref:Sporadically distributed protein, TIGR04141 family n=1 Tax=Lentzea flaviverrucosa TaxID=200379 RepID=A0A1H9QTC7_9PSEU|nr:DUF6119 family protein [Lentzea flaviverrucosa]RDI32766.1 uncharacterized protein (TIGR04141 family) [Lentzea flaviverrucosa]SER63690.1 sporadically distributed protein, TIGR04141 family [Lentzea flaviverrucosa]